MHAPCAWMGSGACPATRAPQRPDHPCAFAPLLPRASDRPPCAPFHARTPQVHVHHVLVPTAIPQSPDLLLHRRDSCHQAAGWSAREGAGARGGGRQAAVAVQRATPCPSALCPLPPLKPAPPGSLRLPVHPRPRHQLHHGAAPEERLQSCGSGRGTGASGQRQQGAAPPWPRPRSLPPTLRLLCCSG